jgi:hypothetical protein
MRTCSIALLSLIGLPLCLPRSAAAEGSRLRLRGQLMSRFETAQQSDDDWASDFVLRRARVEARWEVEDLVRLVVELEASDGEAELRDAYGRLSFAPWLRLSAGHLKKPFSRLRLEALADLPIPERGLLDRHVVRRTRHGGYGARDIGAMISGRIKPLARLHHDIVARLQFRPFKGARLAANSSHKRYDLGEDHRWAHLFGGDLRYRLGGLTVQAEGAYGDNVDAGPDHRLWAVHLLAAYRHRFASLHLLGQPLGLTPAVMFEVFDPDDDVADGRAYRMLGGVNLDVGEIARLRLFAEGTSGEPLAVDPEQEGAVEPLTTWTRVMVQLDRYLGWQSEPTEE